MIADVKKYDMPKKIAGANIFEKNGKILLVDKETASWLVIDKSALPLYDKCDGNTKIQDLSTEFDIEPSALSNWIFNAYKSGMIAINGDRRINANKFKTFVDRYPNLGILHTSNKCNLKCRYCYAHPDSVTKKDMTIDVMKKAIDEMLSLPREQPILSIEFHGGEPLVHYKTIREALEYGKKISEAKGISIIFQIQSNCTVINEEILNFLEEYNVKLRISFDGYKEIHDKNRIFHNGKGSFDIVLGNIRMLQKRGIPFEVMAVVSQTNINELPGVVDFFLENNKITLTQ